MNIYLVVKTDSHDVIETVVCAYTSSDEALRHIRTLVPRMRYRIDVCPLHDTDSGPG